MPLTGILEGFNEQRLVDQKLESEAQLTKFRAVEAGIGLQKLQKQAAVESILAKVFAGDQPGEIVGGDQEIALANKMTKATPLLMQVDPAIGLHFATGASEIRRRKSLAEQERLEAAAKAKEQQGGALASIDSQDTMGPGLEQYVALGGKLPANLTGDWEKDKPAIQQLARSSMTAKEQAANNAKDLDRERKYSAQEDRAMQALATAERKEAELTRKREQDAERKREYDKTAAARQARIDTASIANDRDVDKAMIELKARTDKPRLDDTQMRALAARAAVKAKSRLSREEGTGDYIDLVNEELDRMLDPKNGEIDPGEPSAWFDPFGLTGRKGSLKSGAKPIRKPATSFPNPTPEALKYLQDHPELKAKFKEMYGFVP